MREEIFANKKNVIFHYKLCRSLRFIISHYCFKSVPCVQTVRRAYFAPDSTPLFPSQLQYTIASICFVFLLLYWTYSSLLVPLNSQILLECSDIRIELLWVLIYICSGPFIYNWDIKLMHVFTSLLKVKFHRIFPRDCTVGLHKAGPPGKSWEGIRVGSCQLGIRALGF